MSETTTTSFSDVLNPPPQAPPEEASVADPVETAAPVAVETVSEEKPQEADWQKQATGFKQGMLEERRKRQELEARLAQLTAPAPQVPQPEPVSYYQDPEQFVQEKLTQTEQHLNAKFASATEMLARQAHPDYDEKLEAYKEAVAVNPALHHQVMASENPGEYAYQAGKRHLFTKEYGIDEESILKKAEEKLASKVKAKVEQELMGKVAKKVNQPTNILGARAAGGDAAPSFRPSGWGDVLGKRKR